MRRTGRGRRLGLVLTAIVALVQTACFGGGERPARLADGSPARRPSVALDGARSSQVETRATAMDPRGALPSAVASCLAATREHRPRAPLVSRVGVDGASVTFRTASGGSLVACDGNAFHAGPDEPWCGRALGRVRDGRLLDPRLDLAACSTSYSDPIAFAWVEPERGARYVVVRRHGFDEVYRAVAGLPVRITTTSDIDLETSSASFAVSEHDRSGRLLRSYTLRVRVAG